MKHAFLIALFLTAFYTIPTKAQTKLYDRADYHVHLQDSATVVLGYRMLKAINQKPAKIDSMILNADTIIRKMDKARFKSAWILSNAYWFGSPLTPVDNEYEEVKKQNDWTARECERYPARLKAFMSVNPLKPYALTEIERCANSKRFAGLKLHFANSKVNLFDKAQVKQLQKVFALAAKHHLYMLVHFRSGQKWDGVANTCIFLKEILPFAKNATVVIAHMAGWGGYDKPSDVALGLFARYLHNGSFGHLYFDISAVFPLSLNEDYKPVKSKADWNPVTALKKRITEIGKDHILFGTDWPLIDMDQYTVMLSRALGKSAVQQILDNKVPGM